jgi:hypothetical protein
VGELINCVAYLTYVASRPPLNRVVARGHIRAYRQVLTNARILYEFGAFDVQASYSVLSVERGTTVSIDLPFYPFDGEYDIVIDFNREPPWPDKFSIQQHCALISEEHRVGESDDDYVPHIFGKKDICFSRFAKKFATGARFNFGWGTIELTKLSVSYLIHFLDDRTTATFRLNFTKRGEQPLQIVEGEASGKPVGSLASQLARGELWVRVRGVADLGGGRWLRALRVWSTCNATWSVTDMGGQLLASSSGPLEVRWAGGGDSEVVAVRWGQASKCTVYIEVPDAPLSTAPGTSPVYVSQTPPSRSLRIAVEYDGRAEERPPPVEVGKRGAWQIGLKYSNGYYEVALASLDQKVSIPLTFCARSQGPVCVRARAAVLAQGGREVLYGARAKTFEVGRTSPSKVAIMFYRACWVVQGTVTVSPSELIDRPPEGGNLAILLAWVDCDSKEPVSEELPIVVKIGAGRNEIPPRVGVTTLHVEPPSGSTSASALPGGVFSVSISSPSEVELSFAIGVGLSEEQARKSAVEVDLVDARTGARLRKVKARNLRLRFRLPQKLLAPVYVYLEPRVGGAPVSARLWKFT